MIDQHGLRPSKRRMANDITVTANQWQSNPRQQMFLENYFTPESETFGNVFRSAIKAGYRESYARSLTRKQNNQLWLAEYLQNTKLTPEHITSGITNIATNDKYKASDRLKAYELLGKLQGLFVDKSITAHVNIEQIINDLK